MTCATACGGAQTTTQRAPSAVVDAKDIAASSGPTAYFHEQLVTNGEDVQSDFGSALLTLGMNPRDLQQDTPDHAFQTATEKVQAVEDEAMRLELSRALFGVSPAPAR